MLTAITTDRGQYTFDYDSSNRRTSRTLPNGIVTNYSYDPNGRIIAIDTKKNGVTIDNTVYTFDDTGNLSSKTDLTGTYNYEYDALYRLSRITSAGGTREEYTYDPVGNRLSGSYAQLTEDNPNDETTYSYDYENRLIGVTKNRGGLYKEVSFSYDAFVADIPKQSGGMKLARIARRFPVRERHIMSMMGRTRLWNTMGSLASRQHMSSVPESMSPCPWKRTARSTITMRTAWVPSRP